MSQMPQDDFALEFQQPRSNTLGLVGFILSFCLSPIGLILSLIGLGKPPRGFAIAGVVIGLLGTCVWIGGGMVIYIGYQAVIQAQQVTERVAAVQVALAGAKGPDGKYPADLSSLNLGANSTDPWGHPFTYERSPDGLGYLLSTPGKDGVADNGDDLEVTAALNKEWVTGMAAMSFTGGLIGNLGQGQAGAALRCFRSLMNFQAMLESEVSAGRPLPKKLADLPGVPPKLLNDPWGTPYVYTAADDNKTFILKSIGPDKQAGTQDDIDTNQMQRQIHAARKGSVGGTP